MKARTLLSAGLLSLALLTVVGNLAGCVSAPQPAPQALSSAPAALRGDATATLATNACEAAVAADYTAVIVARKQAAADLRAGRISVDRAQRMQQLADQARSALDAACPGGRPDNRQLDAARAAVQALQRSR